MSDTLPDMNALARRYLDLWQEQVAAVAADPAVAEQLARGVALMASGPAVMAGAMAAARSPAPEKGGSDEQSAPARKTTATTARPAPAASASAESVDDIVRLTQRLADAERRIAALEAIVAGQGGADSPKPARRRTRRTDSTG